MHNVHLEAVDLNLLLALDAIFREQSVTRAGARIGLTQSAMSHALRRLRAMFDDPLFVVVSGRLLPTPRAEALEPRVRDAIERIRRVFEADQFIPTDFEGRVRIAAVDYQSYQFVPELLLELRRSAPQAILELVSPGGSPEALLENGAVDVALLDNADARGLRQVQLFSDDFVVVMRRGHPVADRLDEAAFLEHDHCFLTVTGKGDGAVDAVLAERGLKRRIVLRLPHFLAAPLIVAESDLLLTLPRLLARRLTDVTTLEIRELPIMTAGYAVHLVWHDRVHHDPAHVWLRDRIRDAARRVLRKASVSTDERLNTVSDA